MIDEVHLIKISNGWLGTVTFRGCTVVVSHQWFSKYFKGDNSLDIGVSADIQTCGSPKLRVFSVETPKNSFFGHDRKFIKKLEIVILDYRCVVGTSNPLLQSQFSKVDVGCKIENEHRGLRLSVNSQSHQTSLFCWFEANAIKSSSTYINIPTNTHETEHLFNVGLQHHPNNNHVERLHGSIRQREKVMRGIKIKETPIVEGHRLFYNFIKPHESLNGKTPSEEAGITIEGNNKWLTLMRTAIKNQKAGEVQ